VEGREQGKKEVNACFCLEAVSKGQGQVSIEQQGEKRDIGREVGTTFSKKKKDRKPHMILHTLE